MSDYIKSLKVTEEQLSDLREKMVADYGPKIRISWVCKRELGFTIRDHEVWVENQWGGKHPITEHYLDFYSESLKTAFMLRYM